MTDYRSEFNLPPHIEKHLELEETIADQTNGKDDAI